MLERSAWYLKYRPGDENDSRLCTKFGGKPFRRDNFKWPFCSKCRHRKAFVGQINIATVPPLFQEHIKMTSGLFQLFYCRKCEPDYTFEDIYIIDKSELLPSLESLVKETVGKQKGYFQKELPPKKRCSPLPTKHRKLDEEYNESTNRPSEFVEKVVKGWTEIKELPTYEEVGDEKSDIANEVKKKANLSEEDYQLFVGQLNDDDDFENDCFMTLGKKSVKSDTKLGGWFHWLDWSVYLHCPDCDVMMETTFLQISEVEEYWGCASNWRNAFVMLCPRCNRPGLLRV